mmetsp:Transcript_31980/g.77651  ORF Transcript_31980/g.77651 Transcript_31980/m.77651 type:complete len:103 (-) Transcript_31980:98-406(-)
MQDYTSSRRDSACIQRIKDHLRAYSTCKHKQQPNQQPNQPIGSQVPISDLSIFPMNLNSKKSLNKAETKKLTFCLATSTFADIVAVAVKRYSTVYASQWSDF